MKARDDFNKTMGHVTTTINGSYQSIIDSVKAPISPKVNEKLRKKLNYPQHTWIKIPKEIRLGGISLGTLNSDNRRSYSNRSLSINGLLWFSKENLAQFAATDEYYSEACEGCKKAQIQVQASITET